MIMNISGTDHHTRESPSPVAHRSIAFFFLSIAALAFTFISPSQSDAAPPPLSSFTLREIPFNGERAYGYLKTLCDLGPRPSGSQAMVKQQTLLIKHFRALGANVREQKFRAKHPITGKAVPITNLIIEWNPKATERILLCAHYDTKPRPDNEPNPRVRREGRFIGANDGASGTALLMELAHNMPKLKCKYGVDFILFDGEELVYTDHVQTRRGIERVYRGRFFLGSEGFATQYKKNPPKHKYRSAVLFDMIGDADLRIYQELNSMRNTKSRALTKEIWATAGRLGVKEFVPRKKYSVKDDHLALWNIARIPACDIIDFEYPIYPENRYWHSVADTPNKCSALSLAKVGWVIETWLKHVK